MRVEDSLRGGGGCVMMIAASERERKKSVCVVRRGYGTGEEKTWRLRASSPICGRCIFSMV